jgi:hypothetical protein
MAQWAKLPFFCIETRMNRGALSIASRTSGTPTPSYNHPPPSICLPPGASDGTRRVQKTKKYRFLVRELPRRSFGKSCRDLTRPPHDLNPPPSIWLPRGWSVGAPILHVQASSRLFSNYKLRKLVLRRPQPVSIEAVVSCRRSFAMSQFTICLEHVSDVTPEVVNASAMKAVPIVSSTPKIMPSRRFMAEISHQQDWNAILSAGFQLMLHVARARYTLALLNPVRLMMAGTVSPDSRSFRRGLFGSFRGALRYSFWLCRSPLRR